MWGKSIINKYIECMNMGPECIIYGKDKNINKCFEPSIVANITEIFVDRISLQISATQMREYLINDDYENWKKYANNKIYGEYNDIRRKLMKVNK